MQFVSAVPVGMFELFLADYALRRFVATRLGAAFDVSGQEDLPAPDDRLRESAARERRFPQNILRLAPLCRQIFVVRYSLRVGAAPLRPVGIRGGGWIEIDID